MNKLLACITGLVLISCKTISLSQRNDSDFLRKWDDASRKSISDLMIVNKNDSLCMNNLLNAKSLLLSSLRKNFFDSCMNNNDRIFENEFYILETITRSESMQFDFYVESKQKEDKVFHFRCEKSCLLLSEKLIDTIESNNLEHFFNENNPGVCSDHFPYGSFTISHFKDNEVVSKVYTFPSKEISNKLAQTLNIFENE